MKAAASATRIGVARGEGHDEGDATGLGPCAARGGEGERCAGEKGAAGERHCVASHGLSFPVGLRVFSDALMVRAA